MESLSQSRRKSTLPETWMTGLSVSHETFNRTGALLTAKSLAMIYSKYMDASTRDPRDQIEIKIRRRTNGPNKPNKLIWAIFLSCKDPIGALKCTVQTKLWTMWDGLKETGLQP
jgi:hypothetical protein